MITPEQIIELFGMKPLPGEGGYYVETYRAQGKIAEAELGNKYSGTRDYSTAILYLLTPDTFSRLHRLAGDEIFHFYLGEAVTMLQLHPDGSSEVVTLGQDILNGHCVQITVPRASWQGCFLSKGGRFALMGATTSPGFEFEDREPGCREDLLRQYPGRRDFILKLT